MTVYIKMKTISFILFTITILFISVRLCPAQVDIEAKAELFFQIQENVRSYVDGFTEIEEGTIAPYASHRSAGAIDTAIVARTADGTWTIAWRTAPVPSEPKTDSITFIWAAGFGNNQGAEKFYLEVDDQFHFEFITSMKSHWQIAAKDGALLAFTAIGTSRYGAYLGYMSVTLPVKLLKQNQQVTIRVTGAASTNEVWYRTYAYRDVLNYITTNEIKEYYEQIRFRNFGDLLIKLVAERGKAGQRVEVFSDGRPINGSVFVSKGNLAIAEICVPRNEQQSQLTITSGGKQIFELNLEEINEQRVKAFLEEELRFDRYVFPPGELPGVNWSRPGMVDNELGPFDLHVTYFDRNKLPVSSAEFPGRYAAVVEGTTPAGFLVRRFVTLFSTAAEPEQFYDIRLNNLDFQEINERIWQSQRDTIETRLEISLTNQIYHQPETAILLAGIAEMDPEYQGLDSPVIRDRQWWVEFKREYQLKDLEHLEFRKPVRLKKPGRVLIEDYTSETVYNEMDVQRIRDVCMAWAEEAGEPLVTLVAWKGRIVFHEAFGHTVSREAMTIDTPAWMASITKLLTGVLVMQFVDQGLVSLDEPIERYLPELGAAAGAQLTIRHLLNHTADLGWHGEWASDFNPALENYLAHCRPYLKVGSVFEYNRGGYAVTGKILERLTGKAVPYLFEEYLLQPLAMDHTFVDNTYGGMVSTCRDMAHLGQMLLNRGVYGEYCFFSEDTYRQMLPVRLPGINKSWGVGTAPLGGDGLSGEAFGHEAASGAIFRIDPKYDLIIVSARDRTGRNYEGFKSRLIEACTSPLKKQTTKGKDY